MNCPLLLPRSVIVACFHTTLSHINTNDKTTTMLSTKLQVRSYQRAARKLRGRHTTEERSKWGLLVSLFEAHSARGRTLGARGPPP
jgi:hypothetical protein